MKTTTKRTLLAVGIGTVIGGMFSICIDNPLGPVQILAGALLMIPFLYEKAIDKDD